MLSLLPELDRCFFHVCWYNCVWKCSMPKKCSNLVLSTADATSHTSLQPAERWNGCKTFILNMKLKCCTSCANVVHTGDFAENIRYVPKLCDIDSSACSLDPFITCVWYRWVLGNIKMCFNSLTSWWKFPFALLVETLEHLVAPIASSLLFRSKSTTSAPCHS